MATDAGARQHDRPGAQPAAGPDLHRGVVRHLPPDGLVQVLVAVVLVGDVDVRAGEHVVPDDQRLVGHEVTAPADHAAVPDAQHGDGAEILAGNHPGRQGHQGADQRTRADRDRPLAEHRPGREGRHRSGAERGEPPAGRGVRRDHPGALGGLPAPVHQPPAELLHGLAWAASWPQAPSISRPRVSRTVTGTP